MNCLLVYQENILIAKTDNKLYEKIQIVHDQQMHE